jgi:hypothetical protein
MSSVASPVAIESLAPIAAIASVSAIPPLPTRLRAAIAGRRGASRITAGICVGTASAICATSIRLAHRTTIAVLRVGTLGAAPAIGLLPTRITAVAGTISVGLRAAFRGAAVAVRIVFGIVHSGAIGIAAAPRFPAAGTATTWAFVHTTRCE